MSPVGARPCSGAPFAAASRIGSVRISMAEIRALIAAAGNGSRAGLAYPKTLHPVLGRPILLRLIETLAPIDPHPVVVVSPSGREPIAECLEAAGVAADLIIQEKPTGMG